MSFVSRYPAFRAELEAWYAAGPADVSAVEAELNAASAARPDWTPFDRKALLYRVASERCGVQVFRHCPFFFELAGGRHRREWGFGGIGSWLRRQPWGREFERRCAAWKPAYAGLVLFNGQVDVDLDHHTIGYDNVFRAGLAGLTRQAIARLATAASEEERAFLRAVIAGHEALGRLAQRFAARAEDMLADERDPALALNLALVSSAARHVPAQAPRTFHEALATILFLREAVGSMEGMAVSTLGMVDRLTGPYYEADVAAGRLTRDEAFDLVCAFLAICDAKFGTAAFDAAHEGGDHIETSTTVFIGGCDTSGEPVFNEVTKLIVEAYAQLRLANPKLQARVAPGAPRAYLDLLGEFIALGTNVMCVYHDEVVIAANVRSGKRLEDCRLYVGGGCQENILANCEIHNRATMFFSAPRVLEATLFPARWASFVASEGVALVDGSQAPDFATLYDAFLANLRTIVGQLVARRNAGERDGWRYNPCPLHSSTIDDCVARARDITAGGARYSSGAVDLVGIGTVVDSLFALRRVVFERGQVPLAQMLAILEADWVDEEPLRQFVLHRVPKFGWEDAEVGAFAGQVFADVAEAASGMANSRGGRYQASLFAHRQFVSLAPHMMATPDGRRAGDPLSPGMGPSLLALGERCGLSQVLGALEPLDLTAYPVVAVLDVKLPQRGLRGAHVTAVIERFLAAGGSVLQPNVVDQATLLDAREHPERHGDLVVRISGYSAWFARLPRAVQDEVIARTVAG